MGLAFYFEQGLLPVRVDRDVLRKVALFPNPVLILGESGTGKELLARAIHAALGDKSPGRCGYTGVQVEKPCVN